MFILGIVVALVAAGFVVDVVSQNTTTISVHSLGRTFTISPGWLVVVGVIAGAVGVVGLMMAIDGARRARARRLMITHTQQAAGALEAERDRLAAELEAERSARLRAEETAESEEATTTEPRPKAEKIILTDTADVSG